METKKYNHIELNNEITQRDSETGFFNLEKDKEAIKEFQREVTDKTVNFTSQIKRLHYLVEENYYYNLFEQYNDEEIMECLDLAYSIPFEFKSYMAISKFYKDYALKTNDKQNYLEDYQQHVLIVALYLAGGNIEKAKKYIISMMEQRVQPATPTFLNAGRMRTGEMVSCFLLETGDSLNSINYVESTAKQLSKIGGGVSINLSKLRARGESIKGIKGVAKGVMPVAKALEHGFAYADQLGQRPGSGSVYLNIFHYDILELLDSKKINADEDIRLPTLSIGVVVPSFFFELAKQNKDLYMFGPHSVWEEYGLVLDEINIEEYYQEFIDNENIYKRKTNARDLLNLIANTQLQSGYPYLMFKDNANKVHALKEVGQIKQSNLCVSGETKILTKEHGYINIQDVVNQNVNVWNGEEWSNVPIVQTGENQELVRVSLSNTLHIDCTPYHKFYIQTGYKGKPKEVRAKDLKPGDKLIKFDLPKDSQNNSTSNKKYAYENGFFTGDGSQFLLKGEVKKKIYLYNDKKIIENIIDKLPRSSKSANETRISYMIQDNVLEDKYWVPFEESLQYKMQWLSGLMDADGTLTSNNGCLSLQLSSINKEFLHNVFFFLQELGIYSKISKTREKSLLHLPANDGTGEYKEYECQDLYRIVISHTELEYLIKLGFKTIRINLPETIKSTNRKATHYIKVESVEPIDGLHNTYCFTEPKRHMGMFNGILTGQCTEIFQLQETSIIKDYGKEDVIKRDISCNLASLNITNVMETKKVKESIYEGIELLTFVSDSTNIRNAPGVAKANKELHSVGLGAMNLHGYLTKNHIAYESEEAKDFVNTFFMMMNYYSLKQSMYIARERRETFKDFDKTEYANGVYFDKYINNDYSPKTEKVKALFEGIKIPNKENWERLKHYVMEYGLYNAYRLAIAPTQSISYVQNATSSVLPVVDKIERRLYGKSETFYPMPYMDSKNHWFYKSAFNVDQMKLLDLIAVMQEHIDQGISTILYVDSNISTRELARYYIYAHHLGLKSLYYTRNKLLSVTECISCAV